MEDALYTRKEREAKAQERNPDASTAVINAGAWRKLDLLAIDPNNAGPLRRNLDHILSRLNSTYERQFRASCPRRPPILSSIGHRTEGTRNH